MAISVTAILAAHNEEDILEQVIRELVAGGVSVYVLDQDSTDRTAEIARSYLGRGVLEVESLPSRRDEAQGRVFSMRDVLRRKQELAARLDADWFIHADADEIREGPWEGLGLGQAIERVDRLGYNAIDFELLNFWPVDGDLASGEDVKQSMPWYSPGEETDRPQVKAWKKALDVELVENGGHDVQFAGRRVFPVPFLLRHYPLRGRAHAERKIFGERLGRYDPDELASGWHKQYRGLQPGDTPWPARDQLRRYDAEAVRLELWRAALSAGPDELREARAALLRKTQEAARLEGERDQTNALANGLQVRLAELAREAEAERAGWRRDREVLMAERQAAIAESHAREEALGGERSERRRLEGRVAELLKSKSWRLTAPLRWLDDLVRSRKP